MFLFYLLAFTATEKPVDSSRRANMASVLLPVIKQELVDEFIMIWDLWFVLEDTVQDEKFPGKLKSKSVWSFNKFPYFVIKPNGNLEMVHLLP